MNKLFLGAIASILTCIFVPSVSINANAQSIEDNSNSCQAAIAYGQMKLSEKQVFVYTERKDTENSPFTQKGGLNFVIKDMYTQGYVDNIMNSPAFLKSIAVKVINSCEDIVLVSFGVSETDWIVDYVYTKEEQAKEVEYVCSDSQSNNWDKQFSYLDYPNYCGNSYSSQF